MRVIAVRVFILLVCMAMPAPHAFAQAAAQSATQPDAADARTWLARARQVMGFAAVGDRGIPPHAGMAAEQNYQSDRTYPPFFSAMSSVESWYAPSTGVERVSGQMVFPGTG